MRVRLIDGVITFKPEKKDMFLVKQWCEKHKGKSSVPFSAFVELMEKCPYGGAADPRTKMREGEMHGKCDKHGVDYETEYQESIHKTVQFCPKCRAEEAERLTKLFRPRKQESCPHCGFYCTGKTVFCTPPIIKE